MKSRLICMPITFLLIFGTVGCSKKDNSQNKLPPPSKTFIEEPVIPYETMVCVLEEKDDEGLFSTETVTITYAEQKVVKANWVNLTETNPEHLDESLKYAEMYSKVINQIIGASFVHSVEKNHIVRFDSEIDYSKMDVALAMPIIKLLGDKDSEELFAKSNFSLDEFTSRLLENHKCN